ncbi:ABC transporter ATP-binding protein [Streptomyces sp. E1N211]|uniref:ABC transporter ATP-binding protein n=1 Tax=Streptomyces sp. E1N211 TaxID=1851876 RepID=UPI001F4DC3C5|nr:ABC transporter ATP-binding protein [Streptomyces sp. E1N211]
MIEAVGLTKRYGDKTAVYNLSFQVRPGAVTGFLGPNGSGKSTTMRMILGLDNPTAGHVTICGHPYDKLPNAPRQVGALLDAKAVHGGRSARNHLLSLAQLSGIPARRVDEVLGVVGLHEVAGRRSKGFSLGMGQRLGIAAALLGDPQVLLFDEPVNGLDPEGILWVRNLMKALAAEGRTVFVSSHLMSEMALTADHLIVIGRGQLMADMSVRDFISHNSADFARVRTPDSEPQQREKLSAAITEAGGHVLPEQDGASSLGDASCPRPCPPPPRSTSPPTCSRCCVTPPPNRAPTSSWKRSPSPSPPTCPCCSGASRASARPPRSRRSCSGASRASARPPRSPSSPPRSAFR